ncbi:cytochrome P450 [Actinophytocola sp. NPDC049390]|uniref:cytochrome P450 n=1 Tax=Actinophytocola sp. NPDC049390 TaxID=3363894 RepID=UPI0037915C7E
MTLPPGPAKPRFVQGAYALAMPLRGLPRLRERYGKAFTVNVPIFGRAVVISDPAEIKQLFQTDTALADNIEPNLGRVLGSRSMFALMGEEHKQQRKLLVPPFHGRRLAAYERIFEEATVREMASWPIGTSFPVLPSMMRITLNAILRTVFGAEGREFDDLRDLLPKLVTLGSRLAAAPIPKFGGRIGPWARFFAMRREYDRVIARLVEKTRRAGDLDDRDDVLAMMLQSRYDDGSPMSGNEIADQLLTLLAAGHETTATTLAWTVERLRRHPDVLADLVAEVDAGGKRLREATLIEVQRTRPVIDLVGRKVRADALELGRWVVPKGYSILVSIGLIHDDDAVFPDAARFDPHRFVGSRPDLYEWIPFGGGTRRCIGAAFATLEMNVVLRTVLRDVTLAATTEPAERWHSRGVANAPGKGGLAVVHRRTAEAAGAAETTRSTQATSRGARS